MLTRAYSARRGELDSFLGARNDDGFTELAQISAHTGKLGRGHLDLAGVVSFLQFNKRSTMSLTAINFNAFGVDLQEFQGAPGPSSSASSHIPRLFPGPVIQKQR